MERASAALRDRGCVLAADVTVRADLEAVVDTVRQSHGTVDELTDEQVSHGLDLDLKGSIRTVQAALALMPDGSAIIVNMPITKDTGIDGARAYVERVAEEIPAGRVGQPSDIGNAVAFLAGDRATFVNGIELTVDGGQTQIYAGHS